MTDYQVEFIEFLVEAKALLFGEFTLKSGRISPYFFNSSLFNDGALIERLGYFYAAAIQQMDPDVDVIFGPAYKGVPLCVASAIAMTQHFEKTVGYVFNRKEVKTHGDKGLFVGQMPQTQSRVVMVDDVITDGLTKKEALKLIQQPTSCDVTGIMIALDRKESNAEGKDTVTEFQNDTGIPVHSIVTIEQVCDYLLNRPIHGKVYLNQETYDQIQAYRQQYQIRV